MFGFLQTGHSNHYTVLVLPTYQSVFQLGCRWWEIESLLCEDASVAFSECASVCSCVHCLTESVGNASLGVILSLSGFYLILLINFYPCALLSFTLQHMNQPVPSPYSMITSSSQPQIPSSSMPPSSGGVGPSGSDTQHPQTSTFPGSPSVNPATPHAGTLQGVSVHCVLYWLIRNEHVLVPWFSNSELG